VSNNSSIRIARWYGEPLGTAALAAELDVIGQGTRRFHGDSMLWLGPKQPETGFLDHCMVRHKFYGVLANSSLTTASQYSGLFYADVDCLPMGPGSMHGIVSQHAIDCAQDPRTAIRELARVLAPGGWLLIVGFNPYSMWYLRSLYSHFREDVFTGTHFVSPYRMGDWLKVLGFEVDDKLRFLMYRPPFERNFLQPENWSGIKKSLENWHVPFGGVYYLLARKLSTRIPLTGSMQRSQRLSGRGLPQTLMNRYS